MDLACRIEQAIYNQFPFSVNLNLKESYNAKLRNILFNLSDPKNPDLRNRIFSGLFYQISFIQ